jgi:hypothetical protein
MSLLLRNAKSLPTRDTNRKLATYLYWLPVMRLHQEGSYSGWCKEDMSITRGVRHGFEEGQQDGLVVGSACSSRQGCMDVLRRVLLDLFERMAPINSGHHEAMMRRVAKRKVVGRQTKKMPELRKASSSQKDFDSVWPPRNRRREAVRQLKAELASDFVVASTWSSDRSPEKSLSKVECSKAERGPLKYADCTHRCCRHARKLWPSCCLRIVRDRCCRLH